MASKTAFVTSNLCSRHLNFNLRAALARAMSGTASSAANDVLFEDHNNIGVITLNRPKALNALDLSMAEKILPVLQKWEKEKMFVLVKGAGEKAFCAGGDVRAVTEAGLRGSPYGQNFFRTEYTINGIIGTYNIPYVALIDGIVMGGGVGLSVHGHYRVATERTLFAMPETQIGLFPDVGGSYFLPRLGGKLGLYLALTGVRLRGTDLMKAGIATHCVQSNKLKKLEEELLCCKSECDIVEVLQKYAMTDVKEFSLQPLMGCINKCFNAPSVECIIQNLKNEKDSKWAEETLALLNKMSPTSMKVTLKELELGSKMNLHECLQMEYRLAVNCLANKDFYEGVRALLIDKDQNPKWCPATLPEVTEQLVDSHFAKLPEDQELKHKL